jgi:ABC-type sugar transport system ATPase subunit
MADVELRNVVKVFPNGFRALHGLSLHAHDGEFLVLVGPSGCGKSTVLNLIAGLEPCSDGDILIGDRPVTDEPSKRRDVAMVFQDYALYPHMTVARNIGSRSSWPSFPRARSPPASPTWPQCWAWRPSSAASRANSAAVRSNALRWVERSFAGRRCS